MTKNPTELDEARSFIDHLVSLPPGLESDLNDGDRLAAKLHSLGRLIERLRGESGFRKSGRWAREIGDLGLVDSVEGRLVFADRQHSEQRNAPRQAENLLPHLLIFLHDSEAAGLPVREIIHQFERRMAGRLGAADYDTHDSGAVRFHTNAAFAASRLRGMGLLLDTSSERHRTWRLSLVGIYAGRLLKYEAEAGMELPMPGELGLLQGLHSRIKARGDKLESDLRAISEEAFPGELIPKELLATVQFATFQLKSATGRPVFGAPAPTPNELGKAIRMLANDSESVKLAQRWAGFSRP
tara:strand:- start:489 stop:1382 length:894 start_codon:yes stop_codon:yes gene_type:complete